MLEEEEWLGTEQHILKTKKERFGNFAEDQGGWLLHLPLPRHTLRGKQIINATKIGKVSLQHTAQSDQITQAEEMIATETEQ